MTSHDQIFWKTLTLTAQEQESLYEIVNAGVGKQLPEEQLNAFPVEQEQILQIPTRVGEIPVYVYWPEGVTGKIPLVINFHGGGFVKGRRDQDIVFCRYLCSRAKVAVADVDYPTTPQVRYPGQLYAGYDVVQHLFCHAGEMGIDAEAIAVCGHSAGGNLAASLVLLAIDEGGFVPALQILDYPVLDMLTPSDEKRNAEVNPSLPAWKTDFYNRLYADAEDRRIAYCSPLLASDSQLEKMPPTVILYCEKDIFCDEAAGYHQRLLKCGTAVYGKRFMNSNHGFVVRRKEEHIFAEEMILTMLQGLRNRKGENNTLQY